MSKPIDNNPIGGQGLPEFDDQDQLDEAQDRRAQRPQFRARESDDEFSGVPQVNRRSTMNRFVTALIVAFGLGIGGYLLYEVNFGSGPAKRKTKDSAIENNLPKILIPEPPPIAVRPTDVPPIKVVGGAQPTAPSTPSGPPPMTWLERRMAGKLLLTDGQRNAPGAPPVPPPFPGGAGEEGAQNQLGMPQRNGLSARLEPTLTVGVSASMMPDRRFMLSKTKNLDCSVNEALNSTVPGIVSCVLSHDVWSENGEVLLMERGSAMDGEYQSTIKQGEIRLGVLWTRAKTPLGVQINLNSLGTDALGRSGVSGHVDNHFWDRFGAAIMTSLITTSVSNVASAKSSNGQNVVYGPAVSDGSKVVEKILDSSVSMPPTFVKNQGDHIQVKIARDLDFSTVYSLKVRK